MDVNNSYKRFQNYRNEVKSTSIKQDFMEQNYKVEKRQFGEKRELVERKELPKVDSSFIERTTRLGVNNQGKFFKK